MIEYGIGYGGRRSASYRADRNHTMDAAHGGYARAVALVTGKSESIVVKH